MVSHEMAVMSLNFFFFCEVLRLELYLGFGFFLSVTVHVIQVTYLDLNYDLLACFGRESWKKVRN